MHVYCVCMCVCTVYVCVCVCVLCVCAVCVCVCPCVCMPVCVCVTFESPVVPPAAGSVADEGGEGQLDIGYQRQGKHYTRLNKLLHCDSLGGYS